MHFIFLIAIIGGKSPEPSIDLLLALKANAVVIDKLVLFVSDLLHHSQKLLGEKDVQSVGFKSGPCLLEHVVFEVSVELSESDRVFLSLYHRFLLFDTTSWDDLLLNEY